MTADDKVVLLAGEGANELGGWGGHPAYRRPEVRGILVALLERIRAGGWHVSDAKVWSRIPLYRFGEHRSPETRKVLRLLLDAQEAGFDVVAFTRDTEGDESQEEKVETALSEAPGLLGALPEVVGGVAIQRIESWILALTGRRDTESMSAHASMRSSPRSAWVRSTDRRWWRRSTQPTSRMCPRTRRPFGSGWSGHGLRSHKFAN